MASTCYRRRNGPLPVQDQSGYLSPGRRARNHSTPGATPLQAKQILSTGDLLRLQEVANNFVHAGRHVVRVARHPQTRAVGDERREELGRAAHPRVLLLSSPHGPWRWSAVTMSSRKTSMRPFLMLRHRLVLTYDALADGISPEIVINRKADCGAATECRSTAKVIWCRR